MKVGGRLDSCQRLLMRLAGQVSWVQIRPRARGPASTPIPGAESHQKAWAFAACNRMRVDLDGTLVGIESLLLI